MIEKVSALVGLGVAMDCVCDFLGISHEQFHRWRANGNAYLLDPKSNKKHLKCGEFVMALRQATARYRMELHHHAHNRYGDPQHRRLDIQLMMTRDNRPWSKLEDFSEQEFSEGDVFL